MKRNWGIIISIVLGILAYEMFVVRPHMQDKMQRQRAFQEQQVQKAPVKPADAFVEGASFEQTTEKITGALAVEEPRSPRWEGRYSTELSLSRRLEISTGARMGPLTLEDYFVRGLKDKQAVQIFPNGWVWSSTDRDLQDCLDRLDKIQDNPVIFRAQTRHGRCEVSITQPYQIPSTVLNVLTYEGFQSSRGGHIEFTSQEGVGSGPSTDHNNIVYKLDGSSTWVRDKAIFDQESRDGLLSWLAFGDKYFVGFLVPQGRFNPGIMKERANQNESRFGLRYPVINDSTPVSLEVQSYLGTRDAKILSSIVTDGGEAVDFGFFASITKALLWFLGKINAAAGNYGVSIVILTLLVRIVFWPLNKKVFLSGMKMKALQPKMEELRKKYGNDKEKTLELNREIFGLYKKHKVNPLGSCLPLLAQMPIFFGLFSALNHSLDLYQAPFFGWVQDLSSPDPYYIFPILWTVSLFAYIKLNPQMAQQQPGMPNMLYIQYGMNILFGFLSKDWPAGLTLYLFVSNLVGIVQQVVLKKTTDLKLIEEGV